MLGLIAPTPFGKESQLSTKDKFITHIAGLRGVAVLLVVLNHFEIPGFSSGFIGVDIFFVISGFLITGLLVDEYSRSRDPETRIGVISLKAFYFRRARRILPAATLVTLCILIYSWLVNNVVRFQTILQDGIWATLFSANTHFGLQATDYFQIGAAQSPFQHFWSLSVEEQFYFIWPSVILATIAFRAFRYRGSLVTWQNRLKFVFATMTVLSLVVMVLTFVIAPSMSYFLTISRAWELSAGALAAILVRTENNILERLSPFKFSGLVPIGLLLASMFLVTSNNFGFTMPIVVVASVLILAKQNGSTELDVKALSVKPLTFIGDISYSLYLWHWPIFIFANEAGLATSYLQKALLIALAIALSTASYYFVERKFTAIKAPDFFVDNSVPLSKTLWASTSAFLFIGLFITPALAVQPATQSFVSSIFTHPESNIDEGTIQTPTPTTKPTKVPTGSNWFSLRQAEIAASNQAIADLGHLTEKQISEINRVSSGDTYAQKTDFTCTWGDCTLGKPSAKIKILLLGDSHALMFQTTFSAMRRSGYDLYVRSMTSGLCPNFSGTRSLSQDPNDFHTDATNQECERHHRRIFEYAGSIGRTYDYVVLSDSTAFFPAHYVADATDFANKLKTAGKKTIILGQAPVGKDLATCLNKEYSNYGQCHFSKATSFHDFLVATKARVAYADLGSMFCVDNFCPMMIGNAPIFSRGHLTDAAGAQIAPYFMDFLKDAKVPSK